MSTSILTLSGTASDAATTSSKTTLTSADVQRRAALQQVTVLQAFAGEVLRSRRWRFGGALAGLARLVRLPRLSAANLVPWQQLGSAGEGPAAHWESTGEKPQFLATGFIPAGWLRVRLRLSSE